MPVATEGASLAERIRSLRRKAGLTQQALAGRANVSMSLISSLETGRNTNPTRAKLSRIARALDTTIDAVLSGLPGGEDG